MTTARDEQLSALLDGALSPAEERALRDEIARDPALAARLDELARVDAALRAIPARPVPADLRARLQARLDAEASARPQLAAIRGGAPGRPRISRRAWGAGFAAAAAAALAVVIGLTDASREQRRAGAQLADATPPRAAEPSAPAEHTIPPARVAVETTPAPAPLENVGAPAEPASALPTQQIASTAPAPIALERETADFVSPQADASDFDFEAESVATELAAEPIEEIEIDGGPLTLLVEMNDDEHAALASLALEDAGVVSVLDALGELDALEAGAS
jgi:negative regulator of sigma E activity